MPPTKRIYRPHRHQPPVPVPPRGAHASKHITTPLSAYPMSLGVKGPPLSLSVAFSGSPRLPLQPFATHCHYPPATPPTHTMCATPTPTIPWGT